MSKQTAASRSSHEAKDKHSLSQCYKKKREFFFVGDKGKVLFKIK
jgi:hypothetical protein